MTTMRDLLRKSSIDQIRKYCGRYRTKGFLSLETQVQVHNLQLPEQEIVNVL